VADDASLQFQEKMLNARAKTSVGAESYSLASIQERAKYLKIGNDEATLIRK